MTFSPQQAKTSESWFQDHGRKATILNIIKSIRIMQKDPIEAVQHLLLPIHGFRALIAKCITHNCIQVELSSEAQEPNKLIPQPKTANMMCRIKKSSD
jgi:hypothetical protein